jgi:coenzyme F420-0:L-glutamate ligase/coenzyme F420-1:gamma-L-glutamate ligase
MALPGWQDMSGQSIRLLTVTPLSLGRIVASEDLSARIVSAVRKMGLRVKRGDIIAVSSKIVSISEGRLTRVTSVKPSASAHRLARRFTMNPKLVQVVLNEADQVLGGVKGTLLTVKGGILTPNAGVDEKNAPKGQVVLWPKDAERSARNLRDGLARAFRKELSVIIVDSRVTPLRLGTSGFALAIAGSPGVLDYRGLKDLSGRVIRITRQNLADDLASSAHAVMGEGAESTPAALIRMTRATLRGRISTSLRMRPARCLILGTLWRKQRHSRRT